MIRGARLPVLCVLALLGASACGHAEPPPKVAAPPPPPPERLAKQLEHSLAALSLPDDLVLAGRWKAPSESLARLEAWSGYTLNLGSWLEARFGRPSRPLDLSAPIELMAVFDRQHEPASLEWALSIGLSTANGVGAEP